MLGLVPDLRAEGEPRLLILAAHADLQFLLLLQKGLQLVLGSDP